MTLVLTAIATVGLFLNIYKKRLCFLVWGVSNLGLLILSITAGAYQLAALFIVQLAGAVLGWFTWKPEQDKCQSCPHKKAAERGAWAMEW